MRVDRKTLYMIIVLNTAVEAKALSNNRKADWRSYAEGPITGISVFFFFVLAGSFFTLMPQLFQDLTAFFKSFTVTNVANTGMLGPVPADPAAHAELYGALQAFTLDWAVFLVVVLILRLVARSPVWRTAGTISSIALSFGVSYAFSMFLNAAATTTTWFLFWTVFVMMLGGAQILKAIVLAIGTRI
jgi:hypothetical protein